MQGAERCCGPLVFLPVQVRLLLRSRAKGRREHTTTWPGVEQMLTPGTNEREHFCLSASHLSLTCSKWA